jgi:hypothetical protein
MIDEAVDCETMFAEDLLSQGVAGLSLRDMRTYLEYVADQRLAPLGMAKRVHVEEPLRLHGAPGRPGAHELLRAPRLGLPGRRSSAVRTSRAGRAALDPARSVEGLAPVIVDDMISTGGTIAAAIGALKEHGARDDVTVVVTHGLFAAHALDRLGPLVTRFVVTDTVPLPASERVVVAGLAPLLADAIRRLHEGRSLTGLLRAS